MDVAVARAVGWVVVSDGPSMTCIVEPASPHADKTRRPSTNVADAIAALGAAGLSFEIQWNIAFQHWWVSINREEPSIFPTLPEAACRAILVWAEAKEER